MTRNANQNNCDGPADFEVTRCQRGSCCCCGWSWRSLHSCFSLAAGTSTAQTAQLLLSVFRALFIFFKYSRCLAAGWLIITGLECEQFHHSWLIYVFCEGHRWSCWGDVSWDTAQCPVSWLHHPQNPTCKSNNHCSPACRSVHLDNCVWINEEQACLFKS